MEYNEKNGIRRQTATCSQMPAAPQERGFASFASSSHTHCFYFGISEMVFTESAPWPIQFLSCNFCVLSCVPSWKPRFPMHWILLVQAHIANIWKLYNYSPHPPSTVSIFCWGFGSLRSSILCIVGVLAEGGSVAVAVWVSDRLHIIFSSKDFWYLCYQPHGLRDSVSPVCRI